MNGFELISLLSTIGRAPVDTHSIPATSDEDLDPAEFLSQDAPLEEEYPSIQHQHKDGSSLTDTIQQSLLSEINGSISIFDFETRTDTESPLQYLQQNYSSLIQALNNNLKLHKQALANGSDSLDRIRDLIGENFHQLSENQYALHELYSKESTYNQEMTKKFMKWDAKRSKILDRIRHIKSDQNTYGVKLLNLLDESAGLDDEINQLEAKLLSLKAKKQILQSEIDDTSSVLESKTSKYVTAFQELDDNGQIAILDTLKQNGIAEENASTLINSIPVSVSFDDHYNKKSQRTPNALEGQPVLQAKEPAAQAKEPEVLAKEPIGAQAYEPGEAIGAQAYEPGAQAYEPEAYEPAQAYDPAPFEPYDKGFNKGAEQSERFKQQLQQIYDTYIKPLLEKNTPSKIQVDDRKNTISSMTDLQPIIAFLEHKVEGYSQLSRTTGQKSTIYHQYETSWRDICASIRSRERDLQSSVLHPGDDTDTLIGEILVSTLDYLYVSLSKTMPTADNPLHSLINQESFALISAFSILRGDFKVKEKEYADKFNGFQFPITLNELHPAQMERSESDYLYNVSANAIEHKLVDAPKLSSRPSTKSFNSKMYKGE